MKALSDAIDGVKEEKKGLRPGPRKGAQEAAIETKRKEIEAWRERVARDKAEGKSGLKK